MTNELHPGEVLTAETVGLLEAAGVTPEMLPFTNEVKRVDGQHYCFSATVFAADHRSGKRPFANLSNDSRDAQRYAKDVALAALLAAALNGPFRLSASDEGRVSLPAVPSVPTVDATRSWADWPRRCTDARYEINARPEWEAPVCPFCENEIDQTNAVTIIGGDCLHLAHTACLPEEVRPIATHPQEAASVPREGGTTLSVSRETIESILLDVKQGTPGHARTKLEKLLTHPAREDGPAGQAVVPVELLNEVAGVLDCEGYSSLSLSLLNRLTSGPAAPTKEPA